MAHLGLTLAGIRKAPNIHPVRITGPPGTDVPAPVSVVRLVRDLASRRRDIWRSRRSTYQRQSSLLICPASAQSLAFSPSRRVLLSVSEPDSTLTTRSPIAARPLTNRRRIHVKSEPVWFGASRRTLPSYDARCRSVRRSANRDPSPGARRRP